MHGFDHRVTAATGWLAVAHERALPGWQAAAGAFLAVAFSAGVTSPDIDNTRLWKRLDRWVGDEVLGDGGPLGHRELMHWWGLPAQASVPLAYADLGVVGWGVWAVIFGWTSHLAGDFVFGQEGYGTPLGIPLGPWWWHAGLGLKSGGLIERVLVPAAALLTAWWLAGFPGAGALRPPFV